MASNGNQKNPFTTLRLNQMIHRLLMLVFIVAFGVSVAGVWGVQDYIVRSKTSELLESNRAQLRKALVATSDRKMLDCAWQAVKLLPRNAADADSKTLANIAEKVGTDEIHLCDTNAVIIRSTVPEYIGLEFKKHEQTLPFCCLLEGQREFAQAFGPIAYDARRYRKYVGVALEDGTGFVQLGFNEDRYLPIPDLSLERWLPTVMTMLILLSVFLVVFEIVFRFFRDRIVKPIRLANEALARIASGQLDERVLAGGSTEMDALAEDINTTVDRLKGYIDAAEHRADEELRMAKSIQSNVLPAIFPPYPKLADVLDIYACMITAKEVGGDFYDFFFASEGKLALVIADVSGKGVPAALFMMRAKATLQSLLRSGLSVEDAVRETNNRLADANDANMFVTAWVGVIDIASGEMDYVNAGHNPPLVKRADGTTCYLNDRSGPPLAVMPGVDYLGKHLALGLKDGIILYTDGVTEALNAGHELYGSERLEQAVRGLLGVRDAQSLLSGIVSSVRCFADGAEQADDITMLAFKRRSRPVI